MSHDPLCPFKARQTTSCGCCSAYARVRADERSKTLDAAREAVAALPAPYKVRGDFDTYGPYNEGRMDMKDSALTAIDALRQEKK